MIVIWANKSDWRKPGPIVAMGVLNAWATARAGCETHFFVGEGMPSDTREDLAAFYGIPHSLNLNIHRVARGSSLREALGRSVYNEAMRFARDRLRAGQRVLFCTRELGLVPALARLRRRHRGQLWVFHETHDFHADPRVTGQPDWTKRYKSWCERLFLPRIDGLLCITREQENLYRKVFPALRMLSLPLGTSVMDRAPQETRRARRAVVYVGHLHAAKGVHDVLKMAPRLAEARVRLALFGGDTGQIEKLRRRLRKINPSAGEMVDWEPFVPPAELHRALAARASLMLVPLEDTHYNRYLTCPVKALDALSHGLPAVASELESTREVLGEAAEYVPAGDFEAATRAAIGILDDAGRYARLGSAAEYLADRFSWQKRGAQILEFARKE